MVFDHPLALPSPFSLSQKRDSSAAVAVAVAADLTDSFASCMQGWHYRCLGPEKKAGGDRFLATITVSGSSGPIRFPVGEDELVGAVIHKAVKKYAQEGRLPVLGSDPNKLKLRCVNSGYDALSPWEPIGSCGSRNFILCKEEREEEHVKGPVSELGRKGSGSWKALIKSLGFMIPSH